MQESQEVGQGEPTLKPKTLGKYQLVARLGQGGMATVYLALAAGPAGFSKLMVLKILREDGPSEVAELRHMFAEEARLAARFQHRNIVHTYEVGEIDGSAMMTMEFLDGQTYRRIQARAARTTPLPLVEQLRILVEAAHGLHYAHTLTDFDDAPLGIVHCDVSPQNVFVGYDGQVKLLDFGIAQTRDSSHQRTVEGFKGKLDYVAPEQLRNEPVDARTDVFALGVMLWEAIANARFGGGRSVESVAKVQARLHGTEPRIRDVAPEVPEPLADIVERAIALDPAQRYEDAAAFASALEDYLDLVSARPSARSLARLVVPLFVRERAELRGLIERQVQTHRARQSLLAGDSGFGFDLTRSGTISLGEQTAITVTILPPVEPVTALATIRPMDTQIATVAPSERVDAAAKQSTNMRWLVAVGVVAGALLGLLDGDGALRLDGDGDAAGTREQTPAAGTTLVAEHEWVRVPTAAGPLEQESSPPVPSVPTAADEPAAALLIPPQEAQALLQVGEPPAAVHRRLRTSGALKRVAKPAPLLPPEPVSQPVRRVAERNPYLSQ